jgi:VWFA-related protein
MSRSARTTFEVMPYHEQLSGGSRRMPAYVAVFVCWAFSLGPAPGRGSELPLSNISPETPSHAHALLEDIQLGSKAEIAFDPATQMVTINLRIKDPRGYLIPSLRPDNFLVYEDGVRQNDTTVEVQRSPVTLGILLEYGGRFSAINTTLGQDVSTAATQLGGEITPDDKVALWRYGDRVEVLAGFSAPRAELMSALGALGTPRLSETNLYDSLIESLARLAVMGGPKALLLISSGVDTFSNHEFEEVCRAVRDADLPIYVINLDLMLEQDVSVNRALARNEPINWKRATGGLREIADLSGGRMYTPETAYGLSAIYDNLMESLRVRYVIKYRVVPDGKILLYRKVVN